MTIIGIFSFVLGLIIGSGINAFEYRFRDPKSFAKGRSICPHCKHELSALDLVPVFSYLALQGKCRYCKKKISWHYPVIEILTAVSFAAYALFSELVTRSPLYSTMFFVELILGFAVIAVLVFLLLYDARHQILPNSAVLVVGILGLIGSLFVFKLSLESVAVGAVIGFGFFGLMYLLSQGKWLGLGDVKLGLALGLLLGSPNIVFCLFAAYIVGALYAAYVLARHKKGMKDKIAFGPFLVVAAIAALIFGQSLIHWYIGLL